MREEAPLMMEDGEEEFVVGGKKTWAALRDEVRTVRRRLWSVAHRLPHSFLFRRLDGGDGKKTRIYFMSTPPFSPSRENSLYAIDVSSSSPSTSSSSPLPWIQVLPAGFQGSSPPTKEEQLMMERKRMAPSGIAAYQFHEASAKFVFTASSTLFHCTDNDTVNGMCPTEIRTPLSEGGRLNAEICPGNSDLIAFVSQGDIWVVHSGTGQEVQLTFTRPHSSTSDPDLLPPLSAGIPSYIIQEEFNRFHGFWWQPPSSSSNGVYRLLYEQVDESGVKVVSLLTLPGKESEKYRFPTPGTPNAKSTLKIIEFELKEEKIVGAKDFPLSLELEQHFPWAEYLVRAGWLPDASHVWVELLDRRQQRLELVLIPLGGGASAPFFVIYSERSENWINVSESLTFLPSTSPGMIRFIWASEESGWRHLYLIESELRGAITQPWSAIPNPVLHLSPTLHSKTPLTAGEWEVVDGVVGVELAFGLVFFIGLKDSPLERHLYAASLTSPISIQRLTPLGFSYTAVLNPEAQLLILTSSSTTSPPTCQLHSLNYSPTPPTITLNPITHLLPPSTMEGELPVPEICSYRLDTGQHLFVMIYKPTDFEPNKKYPTILNVYGGPEVQLVYNSFRGNNQMWLYLLVSQGYCVVSIDSRGSRHRGVQFESHIRGRMGTVELKDQVEVLTWLAADQGFIDMRRVGIYGWSYGGYLSLLALAHYPHVFKVAVAGAPVTSWENYDTGYTERYMDLPINNPIGYAQGSVLSYIQQFPDEDDRLLIIHGLVDENVHFIHTAQLINALVRAGKPHQLQLYPSERHSLRRLEASEHYETVLLRFLQKSL